MRRGFTLIELLVVISIVALLSSVILSSVSSARAKARDTQRIAAIQQVQKALELYYSDNGTYPRSSGATAPNSTWSSSNDSSWNTLQTMLSPYISSLPHDPKETATGWAYNGSYAYSYYGNPTEANGAYGPTGKFYMIVFKLENSGHRYQLTDGAYSCDENNPGPNGLFHYGSGSDGVITIGAGCAVTRQP